MRDAQNHPDDHLLDRALPAIAELESSLADERAAERLALHSPDLLKSFADLGHAIAEERGRFDAVDLITPRVWASEAFHSRVFSWLFEPAAHHRQYGHFIAALLNATGAPTELLNADWSAAQVCQEWENVVDDEWGYLDILILDTGHKNLVAIENKTFSQEQGNQLTRYRRALATEYPGFTRHHIFLSPAGVSPYLERDREHWRPASYAVIHDAIQKVLDVRVADPDAEAMLRIYATTIRRNVMPDTSLDQQARRIYLEHWEAIDRIIANKPDWVAETKPMLKEAIAKHPFWILDREDPNYVRFRAAEWDEFPSSKTGTGWAPSSNAVLLFEFAFDDEAPYLGLALSPANPGNAGIRELLFDAVRKKPAVFKPTRNSLVDGWMILHREPECILEPADYGPGWDDGTPRRKIEEWIDRFAAEQFPEMNRIIVDCLRQHQET